MLRNPRRGGSTDHVTLPVGRPVGSPAHCSAPLLAVVSLLIVYPAPSSLASMRTYVRDESRIGIRPLPARVDLGDALAVCVVIRNAEPARFERAALRWLARFCVERREVTLAEVQRAAWAFENITDEPAALETLQRLCSR